MLPEILGSNMIRSEPAYSRTAELYDRLIGEGLFQSWKENFERLRDIFTFDLRTCADIACGTGLAARYLAEQGARVFAVDLSPQMLAEAEKRTRGLEVRLLRQDLRHLRLPERVSLVTCNADSLNHLLGEGDLRAALAAVKRNLRFGGHFMFDVNTPAQLAAQADSAVWRMREDNVRMYWKSSYDSESGIATLEMVHVIESPGGNSCYREVHRERGYGREEVEAAAGAAGYTVLYCWDAAGLGPVLEKTRRIQFLACA